MRSISKLSPHKNIDFSVDLVSEDGKTQGSWWASFNTTLLHCTGETIEMQGVVLKVRSGRFRIDEVKPVYRREIIPLESISFSYKGSILSQLREEILPPALLEFKHFFSGIKSFDLLSPENLRQRTREAGESIGRGGRHLSAFLHELGEEGRGRIASMLRKVYEQLETINTKSLPYGWRQLEILESFGGRKILTEARHVNDGMLRLIAILAELQDERQQFLLFDEIENGINPALVEFVLDALISAPQQVMVTTHSPVILNYLDDEVARKGVIYLYKTDRGSTRSIPFFSIPSLAEKLKFMGPGEAFVDTDLTSLPDEIARFVGGQ